MLPMPSLFQTVMSHTRSLQTTALKRRRKLAILTLFGLLLIFGGEPAFAAKKKKAVVNKVQLKSKCVPAVNSYQLPEIFDQQRQVLADIPMSKNRLSQYMDNIFKGINAEDAVRKARKIAIGSFPLLRATAQTMLYDFKYSPEFLRLIEKYILDPKSGRPIWSITSSDSHDMNYDWTPKYRGSKDVLGYKDFKLTRNDYDEVSKNHWLADQIRQLASHFSLGVSSGMSAKAIRRALHEASVEFVETLKRFQDADTPARVKELEEKLIIDGTKAGPFLRSNVTKVLRKKNIESALTKWTVGKGRNQRFRDDSKLPEELQKIVPLNRNSELYSQIQTQMEELHARFSQEFSARHYKVLDIGQRLNAGTGSLGSERFYVLIKGYSGGRRVILDIKAQSQPADWNTMGSARRNLYRTSYLDPKTGLINHAKRAYEGHVLMSSKANPHSGWVHIDRGKNPSYFTVYELNPFKEGLPLEDLAIGKKDKSKDRLRKEEAYLEVARSLGRTTALGQIRADRKAREEGTSAFFRVDAATPFLAQKVLPLIEKDPITFIQTLSAVSTGYAQLIERDFQALKPLIEARIP